MLPPFRASVRGFPCRNARRCVMSSPFRSSVRAYPCRNARRCVMNHAPTRDLVNKSTHRCHKITHRRAIWSTKARTDVTRPRTDRGFWRKDHVPTRACDCESRADPRFRQEDHASTHVPALGTTHRRGRASKKWTWRTLGALFGTSKPPLLHTQALRGCKVGGTGLSSGGQRYVVRARGIPRRRAGRRTRKKQPVGQTCDMHGYGVALVANALLVLPCSTACIWQDRPRIMWTLHDG